MSRNDDAPVRVRGQQPRTPEARLLDLLTGHRLTLTQRRIAQCLVENAATAAFLSSNELATLTGVSQPSVTRFAIALGYDGYPALRRHLRELHLSEPSPDQTTNEYQRAAAAEIANLEALAIGLADPAPLQQAAARLASSRPLAILGLRAAAPLAAYLAFFAAKFLPEVRLAGTEDDLEQSRAAGGTALLAVVMPRYPREAIERIRSAKRQGFAIVTITDTPMSPAAQLSDVVLTAAVGTGLVFDSQAAPMVLAVVLLQAMAISDAAPQAVGRLEAFESSAERRQLFIQ